jgi:hypothetical protein
VADGAVRRTGGVADGTVGDVDSAVGGAAVNDCGGTGDASGGAGRVAAGVPTCTLDNGTTDDALNASDDNPGTPGDPCGPVALVACEHPVSIPNAAKLTPAHRRPRIFLLLH